MIPAAELLDRFPSIPAEELEEHLSLLNLVNFGGGCYTIYAELDDDEVHVDKELWGDTFRLAPRLTPLEARAIRLALEYVGPMIAADAHTQLARRPAEARGDVRPVRARAAAAAADRARRGGPHRRRSRAACASGSLVEIEYQKEVDVAAVDAARRAVLARARSCRTGTCTRGTARAAPSARSGSTGCAARSCTREKFEPREGFEPTRLRGARRARILYTPEIARYEIERGARKLADGSALREIPVGSDEWLESEILSKRGEAVVLEPDELRHRLAARARELAKELGVERLRV